MAYLNGLTAGAMKENIGMINKEGVGIFYWPDGRIYHGTWANGKQQGYGKYTNANREERYGHWTNGRKDRWLSEEEYNQAYANGHFNFLEHR